MALPEEDPAGRLVEKRSGRLLEMALAIKIQEAVLRAALEREEEEFDLEQKIDLEIKMREGSTKLLAACRHQAQTLEAAKNLLTSNERITQPCLARVSLSDLRMPLIWRDTDHFKNKGDYRRFAVFCLARIGTEIYDTTLLCPVDSNNIPSDFEFKLEVYSHILQDDLSIASTPRKIKKTIHSSISRTVVDHILN
ncbi:Rhotekin [Gryllus bimaculatus]|nr:Rhotekin [Gryllus bimaculatus]